MNWVDDTIDEFGKQMGLSGLTLNDQGIARLSFEKMGALFIERRADEVLVYLVREMASVDGRILCRVLELCHHRNQHPFTVQPGLREDRGVIFLARIPESDFQLPTLERVVGLLNELHDRVSQGGVA